MTTKARTKTKTPLKGKASGSIAAPAAVGAKRHGDGLAFPFYGGFCCPLLVVLILGGGVGAVPAFAGEGGGADAAALAAVTGMQQRALAGDGAWEIVSSLVTEVGHRFAGSPADAAAVVWAEAKLRALGFPKVWTEPVTVPRWVRGEAAGEIVAPWPQTVHLLALGGSVGTPADGIEAEVVQVADVAALELLPDDAVAGKIVFLNRRMIRHPDGAGYSATVPNRSRGAAVAGKKGAVAAIIRSVGTDTNRLPHTGAMRYTEGHPKIPAAALSAPDADLLERQLASGRPVRFRLKLGCRSEGEAPSANVFGEFPGRELPEEIVLLVAHLDSWDVGQGAQDDGTGVALAIEAARLAAGVTSGGPRRTLRVWLTANEEFGLSGARAYAAAHIGEAERHVLAMEADSGSGRALRFTTRFAASDAAAPKELEPLLAPLGIPLGGAEADGGADLSRLGPFGVPLVDLDQDRSLYFDIHHTDNDTLDRVDREALRQLTAAFATVAWWGANRDTRLAPAPKREPRF